MFENREKIPVNAIIVIVAISVSRHVVKAIENLFQHGCFMASVIVGVLLIAAGIHLAFVCYQLPSGRAIGFDEATKPLMWAVLPMAIPSGLSLYFQAVTQSADGVALFTASGNLFATIAVPLSLRFHNARVCQSPG